MAKSLKTRLDDVYRVVIDPTRCPVCGIPKEMPREMTIIAPDDPVGIKRVPYPSDFTRCPECNKPSKFLVYESEERVKFKLEQDRAKLAKSNQDDLGVIADGNLGLEEQA
jgi:hypothetical protein